MSNKGFTIIEVVVAAFILIVGISGMLGLINQTFSYASNNSLNMEATYLGKEGIEIVKNIRDSNFLKIAKGVSGNWNDGLDNCTSGTGGCEADYKYETLQSFGGGHYLWWNGSFWSYDASGYQGPFMRKIIITPFDIDGSTGLPNELNVLVNVSWNDQRGAHTFSVQENLYRWW